MKHNYNLTNEEIKRLLILKDNGDKEARNTLIKSLMFLVHDIALEYNDRTCEFDDLIQTGCEGLIRAIDSFDSSTSKYFKEYIFNCINLYISNFYKKSKSQPKLQNINDYKYIAAETDIFDVYLARNQKKAVYEWIVKSNLTPKQLFALNKAYKIDEFTVEEFNFTRINLHGHKVAALKKLSKTKELVSHYL